MNPSNAAAQQRHYDAVVDVFESIAPCRVRITYANGHSRAGALTMHTAGVHRDPRIDGHGGFLHSPLRSIATMRANGRYAELVSW